MPPDEDPDRKHAAHVAGVAVHALGLRRVRTLSQAASVSVPGAGPGQRTVVRCRRNGLANAPFPLPIFCPADNIEPARPGHLADLSFVDLQNRGRDAPVTLLPYVGPGWYPKVSVDYMLCSGVAQWSDVLHTMDAASHVTASAGAGAGRHGAGLARGRRTYGNARSELDDRAHGARQQQGVHAAQQQQRAGRDRGRHQAGILRRRSLGLHHHPLNPQHRDAAPHPQLRARLRGDDGGTHPTRTGPSAKVHQAGENGLRGAAGHAAEVPRQPGAARPQHVPRR